MESIAELRAQAQGKRRRAQRARDLASGLSLDADRTSLLQNAQVLEAEAAALEFQADMVDAQERGRPAAK